MSTKEVACIMCIARDGLVKPPRFYSQDDFAEHLEKDHHVPIKRDGESNEEMRKRFLKENPAAWGGQNVG